MGSLGRRQPTDDEHVQKYPFSAVAPPTVSNVSKILRLPRWHWEHDQGAEGACEGFGNSMMMSITNKKRYNPRWLWNEAKKIDEWPDTNPGDDNGTSGRAACSVLQTQGHALWDTEQPLASEGIAAYRWATTVDEMRAGLNAGMPIAIGVNWYENFDKPVTKDGDNWIGLGDLGTVRGGHCVCIYGASDKRQAFRVKNSWGRSYPLVWLTYDAMKRLLQEDGESCLITDK